MVATPLATAKPEFFDGNGNPLVGGTLGHYTVGTLTPKTTWADSGKVSPNSNPITLDARGEVPVGLYGEGDYRQILKDAGGSTIWDVVVSSFQKTITSSDVTTALGYTPVNPAANNTLSGTLITTNTVDLQGTNTLSGPTTVSGTLAVNNTFTQTAATLGLFSLVNTDAGATAAIAELYRNSASPAANDILFALQWTGKSSTSVKRTMTLIQAQLLDATNTSEDAELEFWSIVAGTLAQRVAIGQGLYTANATGGDKGADTINASNYFYKGVQMPRQGIALSGALAPTPSNTRSYTHGIGSAPSGGKIGAFITCTTGDLSYSIGDTVFIGSNNDTTGTGRGITVVADATTLSGIIMPGGIWIAEKTTRVNTQITTGSWNLFLFAEY